MFTNKLSFTHFHFFSNILTHSSKNWFILFTPPIGILYNPFGFMSIPRRHFISYSSSPLCCTPLCLTLSRNIVIFTILFQSVKDASHNLFLYKIHNYTIKSKAAGGIRRTCLRMSPNYRHYSEEETSVLRAQAVMKDPKEHCPCCKSSTCHQYVVFNER